MKKYLIPLSVMAFVGIAVTSCAGASNAKKPLIFFNRQPSNADTGEIDMTSMNHNDSTYYVGFDAAAGGTVQGTMITDFLKTKTIAELDRDGDGTLSYVLFVGDEGHNDSKARTLGIRTALKTVNADKSTKAGSNQTVEGSVTVKDGTLKVKEIESAAMTGSDGSTWNADAAGTAFKTWAAAHTTAATKMIEMVVSNNDGMAMGALTSTVGTTYFKGTNPVPLFGYDANADACAEIKSGHFTGTVSQNVDAQAEGTLEMIRNLCDGVTGAASYTKGFTEADQYGNKITIDGSWVIKTDTKAILAPNVSVTSANIDKYYNATSTPRDAGIKDITATAKQKKVFIDLYNGSDNFLSQSYRPALNYYAPLMNIKLSWVDGDGQSEDKILNNMVNLGNYDAYAINMVKTNSGSLYTAKLK
jgi:methyl-galactoside transport system substrate-binding protein